jgi:hypothetical protein
MESAGSRYAPGSRRRALNRGRDAGPSSCRGTERGSPWDLPRRRLRMGTWGRRQTPQRWGLPADDGTGTRRMDDRLHTCPSRRATSAASVVHRETGSASVFQKAVECREAVLPACPLHPPHPRQFVACAPTTTTPRVTSTGSSPMDPPERPTITTDAAPASGNATVASWTKVSRRSGQPPAPRFT